MAQIFRFPRRKLQTLNEWLVANKAKKLSASLFLSLLSALLWLMLFVYRLESDPQHLMYVWIMGSFCVVGAVMLHLFAGEILMETEWKCLAVGMPIFFSIALLMEVRLLRSAISFLVELLVHTVNSFLS